MDADYKGVRYFVPAQPHPGPIDVLTLGQYANDFAADTTQTQNDQYRANSAGANLLVLMQRLERSPEDESLILPSRPISVLRSDVVFENTQPMEIGCEYGEKYWYGS